MAKIFVKNVALAAVVEVTEGVNPGFTLGANAMQTKDFSVEPMEGEEIKFDVDSPNFGAVARTLVGRHCKIKFMVPYQGSGVLGTPPAWLPLIRASAHSATIDPGIDVRFRPVNVKTTATLVAVIDKLKWIFTGTAGTVGFNLDNRQYPWLEFEFMGLFSAPVLNDLDLATVNVAAFLKPLPFRKENVVANLLGSLVGMHKFAFKGGNEVQFYDHSEEESIQYTARESSFDITIENTSPDTKNWIADLASDPEGVLNIVYGVAAGSIIEFNAAKAQPGSPKFGQEKNIQTLQMTGPIVRGNPDYEIICR